MTDSDQHLSNETQLEFTNNDSNDQNPATDVADMNLSEFRRVVQESQPQDNHLPAPPRAVLKYIPEVTDDFIRNFLLRNNMLKTLEQFEVEWYSRFGSAASRDVPLVPDNYLETAQLSHRIELLERDLREHAELTTTLNKQWRQAKKERDFHKANHSRVVQEKNKLTKVLKQTDRNAADLTPTLEEMKRRCDGLLKQKTVLSLEKDKLAAQVEQLEKRLSEAERRLEGEEGESSTTSGKPKRSKSSQKKENTSSSAARKRGVAAAVSAARTGTSTTKTADGSTTDGFVWPPDERPNTEAAPPSLPSHVTQWSNTHTFTAHAMSVTKIALHPRKPAVASCSDDGTWRLSTVPEGELILSGEGHQNWVAAVAMHPAGTMVATGSGDKTVKLWDFATNSCANTLRSHTDGVWSVDFQETGALLASGSLDTTARVWDVEMGKCRQTLRRPRRGGQCRPVVRRDEHSLHR
ncbi:hypothetical protein AGDE_12437 [Angomonas deanei]|nr:hypothetical protein AGDE_12437 [Angomonas deanei]|eukprot:EPY24259.1 hypothetical protein AGDE_12437 [Angomonas deanei]